MDDRAINFVIHQPESNQWVEVQNSGNLTTTITRHFDPEYMKVELMAKGVGAMSMFKRRKNDSIKEEDDFAFSKK